LETAHPAVDQLAKSISRPLRRFLACPECLHERARRWAGNATNIRTTIASSIVPCQPSLDFVQVASLERRRQSWREGSRMRTGSRFPREGRLLNFNHPERH
jgi:hypothetical protein